MCRISETMGSVCSEIPELPEIVEGVVAKSEAVTEGNMLEVEMDGNKVSCQLYLAEPIMIVMPNSNKPPSAISNQVLKRGNLTKNYT